MLKRPSWRIQRLGWGRTAAFARACRLPAVLVALAAFLPVAGAVAQPPSKDLKQCKNGTAGRGPCVYPATGNEPGWDNGTVNSSNGLYRMGDFVPFRLVLSDLQASTTYSLELRYRAVHNGLHSYDYLGSYDGSLYPNGLLQRLVPCGGVAETRGEHECGAAGGPDTVPVPPDPRTAFPSGRTQGAGHLSAWGATFSTAHPPRYTTGTNCYRCEHTIVPGTTGNVSRQLEVTFTTPPAGHTVVLAWGAHIATPLDWGFGRTYAERGSGASGLYMYLGYLHRHGGGSYSPGQVARTLNVNAIGKVEGFATHVAPRDEGTALPVNVGQPVTDTATLTARGNRPVTGRVQFFVCGPEPGSSACHGGAQVGPAEGVEVHHEQGSPHGVASTDFTPQEPGHYCFRTVYLPGPPYSAYYSPAEHTATTGECFEAVEASLRVTKECSPSGVQGLWNLLVGGNVWGEPNVGCEQYRGPLPIAPGDHQVSEQAVGGTDPNGFDVLFSDNCANGTITVPPGSQETCVITNHQKGTPAPASLTLHKVCDPANDPGRFEIEVDGVPVADLGCGTSESVDLAPGSHAVSEVGVSPTRGSDYTSEFLDDCAPGGSITLTSGQASTCTIRNTHRPPTATLRVDKACVPPGDAGRFNLTIDGQVAGTGQNVGCLGTTGFVQVSPGTHTVAETAASDTQLANYKVLIDGDCAANGSVTVAAGAQATCLISNVRPAAPARRACYSLSVAPRTVSPGRVRVTARVHLGSTPVRGVRVYAAARRLSTVRTTRSHGRALFVLRLRHPGVLRVSIRKPYLCPQPHPRTIAIRAAARFTG